MNIQSVARESYPESYLTSFLVLFFRAAFRLLPVGDLRKMKEKAPEDAEAGIESADCRGAMLARGSVRCLNFGIT